MSRRVAITGIGLATSLGRTREETWNGLCRGDVGVRRLSLSHFPHADREAIPENADWMFGAPVDLPRVPRLSRLVQLAELVTAEAVAQRGGLDGVPADRRGVVLGTSKTDLFHVHERSETLWTGHACSQIAHTWNCAGASLAPVAACATGLVSLIRGAELIQHGHCDLVLAGSVDASLHPAVLASYRRLGVLAKAGADGQPACRPFDLHRSGFAIGEGGAVLVLEAWENAIERGQPLAEWLGGYYASDPTGIAQVDESGEPLTEVGQRLFRRLEISIHEVDSIALHGTATIPNDLSESRGMGRLFGERMEEIPVTAVKGAIGHLLGAAGAVEVALTVLGIRDGIIPPITGLQRQDPECHLRFSTVLTACPNLNTVLKVSLGFGGHIAAGVLRRAS